VSPETFRFEDSAGGWSPSLSVIGRLQFDGRDVAAVLVEAAVVETSEPIRRSPPRRLGQRPGAFAQFRHVTAGTKQVLAESPQRPLTGIFGQHSGSSPQYQ
jgi:hypothetical protein